MKTFSYYQSDPWLSPFIEIIEGRYTQCIKKESELTMQGSLCDFAMGHHYYGLHRGEDSWIFREWAPNATDILMVGAFNNWGTISG